MNLQWERLVLLEAFKLLAGRDLFQNGHFMLISPAQKKLCCDRKVTTRKSCPLFFVPVFACLPAGSWSVDPGIRERPPQLRAAKRPTRSSGRNQRQNCAGACSEETWTSRRT